MLRPQALFGLSDMHEITHCLFWSMVFNIGAYLLFSLRRESTINEATQATLSYNFV